MGLAASGRCKELVFGGDTGREDNEDDDEDDDDDDDDEDEVDEDDFFTAGFARTTPHFWQIIFGESKRGEERLERLSS